MVLLNAPTVSVHKSEIMLRRGKALVRGKAVPFQSLCVILGDTAGVSVHKSEIKLGTWVTSLGKLTKKLNCSCIIAPAKCGERTVQITNHELRWCCPRLFSGFPLASKSLSFGLLRKGHTPCEKLGQAEPRVCADNVLWHALAVQNMFPRPNWAMAWP